MLRNLMGLTVGVLLSFVLSSAGSQLAWLSPQSTINISTPEELHADVAAAPCKNAERLPAVRSLFERVGAPAASVSVDKYKDVENVAIRKQGSSSETIVIGAHYDMVQDGCGVIDNWTGIAALAHVYRSVKDTPLRKSLIFVAFGREEQGLVGSRAMANAIPRDQLGQYCAMINIDSLGLGAPQVLDNASSNQLKVLAATIAKDMKMPFGHANVRADSDSSSFVKNKIPAVTIHGLTNDWSTIIHTRHDQLRKVNPDSLYLGYRLVLALVGRLEASPCAAYH